MKPTPVAILQVGMHPHILDGIYKGHLLPLDMTVLDEKDRIPRLTSIRLFTEAQLNQARADALREAAEVFQDDGGYADVVSSLKCMAAEIEGGKK